MPFHHFARRINVEQLRRHRQHRLPRAPLNFLPRTAAELVELRLRVVAADVPLNEIYPLDRHVHRVVARVFEIQKIALDVGDLHVPQAAVLGDAVIDMHDEIVGLQLFEIEQRALGRRPLAPAHALLAKNFFFAVNVEAVLRQNDARGNLAFHDRRPVVGPFEQRRQTLAVDVDVQVPRLEMTPQPRHLVRALDDHQRSPLSALDFAQFRRQRLEARWRLHSAQLVRSEPQGVLRFDFDRHRPSFARRRYRHQRADLDRGEVSERALECVGGDEQRLRRRMKRGLLRRRRRFIVHEIGKAIGLGEYPPRIDQPQQRARRHVVEHAVERPPVRIRHQQFRAREQQAILERFGQFGRLLAHHPDFGGAQRNLIAQLGVLQRRRRHVARTRDRRLDEVVARALSIRVEMANRSDQIVFEFDANRIAIQRRERIDESAAHAEVARLFGLRHALIAARRERFDQGVEVEAVARWRP